MTDKKYTITDILLIMLGAIAAFHNLFVAPYYIVCVYDWYLLELFKVTLSYHNALGLEFFISLLTIMHKRSQKEDFNAIQTHTEFMLSIMFGYIFSLGIAWLLKGINF